MDCPDCGGAVLPFSVPGELREYLPGEETAAAICRRCLALHPVEDAASARPDFQQVSDAFPGDPDAALPMALLVGLLPNLALYRAEISELLERVERAGTDPLLVLDRLARDEAIETDLDLAGRRRQLEQLL
jgi:hypothetical protein